MEQCTHYELCDACNNNQTPGLALHAHILSVVIDASITRVEVSYNQSWVNWIYATTIFFGWNQTWRYATPISSYLSQFHFLQYLTIYGAYTQLGTLILPNLHTKEKKDEPHPSTLCHYCLPRLRRMNPIQNSPPELTCNTNPRVAAARVSCGRRRTRDAPTAGANITRSPLLDPPLA